MVFGRWCSLFRNMPLWSSMISLHLSSLLSAVNGLPTALKNDHPLVFKKRTGSGKWSVFDVSYPGNQSSIRSIDVYSLLFPRRIWEVWNRGQSWRIRIYRDWSVPAVRDITWARVRTSPQKKITWTKNLEQPPCETRDEYVKYLAGKVTQRWLHATVGQANS